MFTHFALNRLPVALASLAVGAVLIGVPRIAAADDAAKKLIETRRATALAHLKIQEANAIAELKELQSLSTVEDWARHEREKKNNDTPQAQVTDPYGNPAVPLAPGMTGTPGTPAPAAVVGKPAFGPDMPRLVAVFGSGKNLIAALRYRSGLTADVRVGDYLETDHKVTQITPDSVRVTKDGKSEILTVYAGAPRPVAPTNNGGGMGPVAGPVNPMGPVPSPAPLPFTPSVPMAPPPPPPMPDPVPMPQLPNHASEMEQGAGPQYDIPAFREDGA